MPLFTKGVPEPENVILPPTPSRTPPEFTVSVPETTNVAALNCAALLIVIFVVVAFPLFTNVKVPVVEVGVKLRL